MQLDTATSLAVPSPRDSVSPRIVASVVALAGAAILMFAAWLEPSPKGYGTHTSVGMPSCLWVATMNMPCPTCGMTTSFAHAADGHLGLAFKAQPAGAVLAIAAAMTTIAAAYVAITGRRLDRLVALIFNSRLLWLTGGLVVFAWIYKIGVMRGWFAV